MHIIDSTNYYKIRAVFVYLLINYCTWIKCVHVTPIKGNYLFKVNKVHPLCSFPKCTKHTGTA